MLEKTMKTVFEQRKKDKQIFAQSGKVRIFLLIQLVFITKQWNKSSVQFGTKKYTVKILKINYF